MPRHSRSGRRAVGAHEHLARVDVNGVGRTINIGLLEDEDLRCGDWVLIHVGFAMSKIDEEEARLALASLKMLGEVYTDEVDALLRAVGRGIRTRSAAA